MSPSDDPDGADERRRLLQLTGMGLEFAGATIGLGAAGWGIDAWLGTEPWGMLIGGLLGVTGGMYLLIRNALAAQKDALERQRKRSAGRKAARDTTPKQEPNP